jgi:hypothetical protein
MEYRMHVTKAACSVKKLMERFFHFQGSDVVYRETGSASPARITTISIYPTLQEAHGC